MSFGELVDDIQCDNGIGQLVSAPRALGIEGGNAVADRGEGIDLIEMIIAPPVCLVPYAGHQNPAGVIIAQQLYVHAENIRELSDGKIFFHTMHQSFQIRLRP